MRSLPAGATGAVAVRFAQERAKVFAVDISKRALEETTERMDGDTGEIALHICDVASSSSVAEMVKACVARFGRVDSG